MDKGADKVGKEQREEHVDASVVRDKRYRDETGNSYSASTIDWRYFGYRVQKGEYANSTPTEHDDECWYYP